MVRNDQKRRHHKLPKNIGKIPPLAFKHCLRFSRAVFPGGAAADSKRGNTACIAEGYIPPTSPGYFIYEHNHEPPQANNLI